MKQKQNECAYLCFREEFQHKQIYNSGLKQLLKFTGNGYWLKRRKKKDMYDYVIYCKQVCECECVNVLRRLTIPMHTVIQQLYLRYLYIHCHINKITLIKFSANKTFTRIFTLDCIILNFNKSCHVCITNMFRNHIYGKNTIIKSRQLLKLLA